MTTALTQALTMHREATRKPAQKRKPMNAVEALIALETYDSENQLQNCVVKRLRPLEDALGFRVVAIPNGGKRRAKEAAQMKNRGVRAGFPDLMILAKMEYVYGGIPFNVGQPILIELKQPDGSLSDEQVEWHAWLGKNLMPVYICTSVGSVLTVLRSHGLKV